MVMKKIKTEINSRGIVPFIGIYDVFSATQAARHYDAVFVSGYGFAASHYGLPDIGFIAWSDIVAFIQRIRSVLPDIQILVDIDDGYVDVETACHVVSQLEYLGASGVVLEDQKRPRRCGHLNDKLIMDLDEFIVKLENVLRVRKELFVVARTDASDIDEIVKRVHAFAKAGADAILVDGLTDIQILAELTRQVDKPFVFNQIAGGKSPNYSLSELKESGVSVVIYSTPCLFTVHSAIDNTLQTLKNNDGNLISVRDNSVLRTKIKPNCLKWKMYLREILL